MWLSGIFIVSTWASASIVDVPRALQCEEKSYQTGEMNRPLKVQLIRRTGLILRAMQEQSPNYSALSATDSKNARGEMAGSKTALIETLPEIRRDLAVGSGGRGPASTAKAISPARAELLQQELAEGERALDYASTWLKQPAGKISEPDLHALAATAAQDDHGLYLGFRIKREGSLIKVWRVTAANTATKPSEFTSVADAPILELERRYVDPGFLADLDQSVFANAERLPIPSTLEQRRASMERDGFQVLKDGDERVIFGTKVYDPERNDAFYQLTALVAAMGTKCQ